MRSWHRVVVTVLLFAATLPAQRRVDPRYSFHRVIAAVPLVGSGSPQDPVRPKYIPAEPPGNAPGQGIIAFATE